ncbi:ribosome-associated protein [Herbaspirillum sp. Sphag1AN]|uniref:ribosome silencing factor n=1 Tax=unclassified Herbaspirillum TaxID=2624150 RepID=UPI00161CF917|nr:MULTISPECIES: ribosome silencing factor [unclassified Herbaspirillum]MBB3214114.1 ribosome-associated protein [Herbaspirillum sp. Sphag1AN]MBB3247799.1 ribosome-associated protein [Herbaspirillum sp. Sphag64]
MDIKKLQTAVVDALEDVKAQDIKIFDTTHLTSLFDRVAIASGTSNRQTKALAASVRDKVKAKGGNVISIEGEDTGEWVLVDLGDMIVHIMQPAIRAYYRLEEIWGEKEVKLGAAKRVASTAAAKRAAEDSPPTKMRRTRAQAEAVEASQALDDDEPKKPARKPRAATGTTAATKTVRTTTGTARTTRSTSSATGSSAGTTGKTVRKPRASTTAGTTKTATGTAKRAAPAKKAVGKTIKVAAPKSATAPKKAPAKRAPRAKA